MHDDEYNANVTLDFQVFDSLNTIFSIYVVRCAIQNHLYNLKNAKNTHGGVLILVVTGWSLQLY